MSIFLVIWGQWPPWLQQSRVLQVNILKSTRSECSCHCFTRDLTFFEKNQNLRQKNLRLREKIPKTRPMRKIHANQSFIRRNQFFQWKSSYRTSATVVRHFPIVFDHWHWHSSMILDINISETFAKWPLCWPRCRGSPAISLRSTRFVGEMLSTIQNATKAGTLLFPTKIICTLALSILSFHSTCCCSMLRSETYMSNYTTWPQKSVTVKSTLTKC